MLTDYNTQWLEKRLFIPWNAMSGVGQIVAAGVFFRSQQSATSLGAAVAASLGTKLGIAAQNDGVSHFQMMPYDFDINKQLRFRVHYTQTAVSGTVTWQILYLPILATAAGTAGATVIAAPATALSFPIAAASGTVVANDWRFTGFGVLNRSLLPKTTYGLGLALICTDAAPVAGLGLLGLELRYTPRKTAGQRRNILGGVRLTDTAPLGVTPQDKNVTQDPSGHAQEGL